MSTGLQHTKTVFTNYVNRIAAARNRPISQIWKIVIYTGQKI